jgi:hypothetical protein
MKRLYETTFTVAAGTALAAPQLVPVALEDAQLESVRIVIPDGHSGFTGLQVRWGGTQVIPFGSGTWITANAEVMDIDWAGEITADGLVLAGYNTDVFDHSFYLRWLVSDLAPPSTATVVSAQAGGAAAADASGVATLTSATAPGDTLPDIGAEFGDTGQAVPDLVLPPDLVAAEATADSVTEVGP